MLNDIGSLERSLARLEMTNLYLYGLLGLISEMVHAVENVCMNETCIQIII